jgi:hypothetical protein
VQRVLNVRKPGVHGFGVMDLERRSHGKFQIVLNDGTRLMLNRNYGAEVEMRPGQSL